jgi:hypothetical protein
LEGKFFVTAIKVILNENISSRIFQIVFTNSYDFIGVIAGPFTRRSSYGGSLSERDCKKEKARKLVKPFKCLIYNKIGTDIYGLEYAWC